MRSYREVMGDSAVGKKKSASGKPISYLWLLIVGKEKPWALSTPMAANNEESTREDNNHSANDKTVAMKSQAIS